MYDPDEELHKEKEEPLDPVNDPKTVNILLTDGTKLPILYKNIKKCHLFKSMLLDSNFEDIPAVKFSDWALKQMFKFLDHYSDIKTPPIKHPARKKPLETLKHLMPFLKEEDKKNPEMQLNLLNLISYCTTDTKELEGEEVLDDWLARFLVVFDMPQHSEMIRLADFVDCQVLHNFLCAAFALKYLIGLNTGEMRSLLKVDDDFSEDEKKKLHYHFVWEKLIDWKTMKVTTAVHEEKKKD